MMKFWDKFWNNTVFRVFISLLAAVLVVFAVISVTSLDDSPCGMYGGVKSQISTGLIACEDGQIVNTDGTRVVGH